MLIGKIGPQFQYMTDVRMAGKQCTVSSWSLFLKIGYLIVLRQSYETSAAVSHLYERMGLGIPIAVT